MFIGSITLTFSNDLQKKLNYFAACITSDVNGRTVVTSYLKKKTSQELIWSDHESGFIPGETVEIHSQWT